MPEAATSVKPLRSRAKTTPQLTPEQRFEALKARPVRTDIPLQIGAEVREVSTQTYGVAVSRHEMLGGTVQYSVQSESTDGFNRSDPWGSDWQTLEVIGEGLISKAKAPAPCDIEVGDEVEDTVSGFKGIVGERTTFLNGCIYFHIRGKYKPTSDAGAHDLYVTALRCKKIGVGVRNKLPTHAFPSIDPAADAIKVAALPPEEKAKVKAPPGGPSRRMSQIGRSEFRR